MQQQYRQYNQQQVPSRGQHAPNQRRGGIGPMMSSGPHHQVPLTQAQLAQQAQAQAHASELAKRRSRKPTDKTMPDGVEDCVVDVDGVLRYRELRDLERRLDASMTRKRLDIVDSATRNTKASVGTTQRPIIADILQRYKTLRIWISNTVEDQLWQGNSLTADTFDFGSNMEASYRVKIEGRLLEDEDARQEEHGELLGNNEEQTTRLRLAPTKGQNHRFSFFFKSLSVDFDKSRARVGAEQSVEWKKPDRTPASSNPPAVADFDELTFKRNGDENINVTINLLRHEDPERFSLTPELADIVDMSEGTRQEVMIGVWEYIKLMGLQEDEDKRNFRCDDLLRKVFPREVGMIPLLNEYISPHLKPLPPISLAYTIRVDEEFHRDPQPTIYDIRVAVDDPLRAKLYPYITNPSYAAMLKEVTTLDEQLAHIIQAIGASKAKNTFFSSLAADPANFIRQWLSSQKRDLDVIMGEATRGGGEDASGDEWRKGGKESVWGTVNAKESVSVMLSKQPQIQR